MKILGTGLSGLVGSRIVELLKNDFEFDSSIEDITDKDLIRNRIKSSNATCVLHLAAKTDVDGCEKDKDLKEEGEAWRVNVTGTKNVADACFESGKKLIYISTDFVFDGQKEGAYDEQDFPNPINWYGHTKYEGEKIVSKLGNSLIVRIAYPYRKDFEKLDFLRKLIKILKNNEEIRLVTDHTMTPTFIDDIAGALKVLVDNKVSGIYHVVGSEFITPFSIGIKIVETLKLQNTKISPITREEFFKGRAQRGFNLAIKNDKIGKLGIKMKTFEEGLKELI